MRRLVLALLLCAIAAGVLPASSSALDIETFVGCDDSSADPVPSHLCDPGNMPAAYFEADEDVDYDVCVEFPDENFVCVEEQPAAAAQRTSNSILAEEEGTYRVYWYLGDDPRELPTSEWSFRVEPAPVIVPPPPPPSRLVQPTPPTTPGEVTPTETIACMNAKIRIATLRGRIRKVPDAKRKSKLAKKLSRARGAREALCA